MKDYCRTLLEGKGDGEGERKDKRRALKKKKKKLKEKNVQGGEWVDGGVASMIKPALDGGSDCLARDGPRY